MALTCVTLLFTISSILIISASQGEGSWVQPAMQPEAEDLRALEKRRLLNEVEVLDDEEEQAELEEQEEEEMRSRSEEYESIYNQLRELADNERKRDVVLRQTPVPAIRRLKITPPPNVPEPQYRLPQTPIPSGIQRRPTPGPDYPFNIANGPLRQTPKPLRLTPAPGSAPVKPNEPSELIDDSGRRPLRQTPAPYLMTRNELMWKRILARRAKDESERIESQRRNIYYP